MDQLKGKVVNVVLTVQEGKALEPIKNEIQISANFNGRVLESDPVPSEENPLFTTNLIWEIEKRDLRKIRSSNQPLRVEVIGQDVQGKREKFGHLLLDLRSTQIVLDPDKVKYKWHKLIGVRNKKRNSSPELYLSLAITTHEENNEEINTNQNDPIIYFSDTSHKQSSIPIEYLDDGFIKIGSERCDGDFNLTIFVESASNLDLLLPEVLVFRQNKNKYCMCVNIFGIPIKTKVFSRDLHDSVIFDEKIVIRISSNVETLTKFFPESSLEVGFLCGQDLLGSTVVGFDSKIATFEKVKLSHCRFKFPSPNGIVPTSVDGRQPSVSLEFCLVENVKKPQLPHQQIETCLELDELTKASGDHNQSSSSSSTSEDFHLDDWKEAQMAEFNQELERLKNDELVKVREEYEYKKKDLDENVRKCKDLQDELEMKLEELKISKTLRSKRKLSTINLSEICEENLKKYENCDKDLLIEYLSKLQRDNDKLKNLITEQKRELDAFQKSALTREQTSVLLQELKGLEEKFAVAQQTKSYFKEQWKLACEEIHEMKGEELKTIQDQIQERREELHQLRLHSSFDYEDDVDPILALNKNFY